MLKEKKNIKGCIPFTEGSTSFLVTVTGLFSSKIGFAGNTVGSLKILICC